MHNRNYQIIRKIGEGGQGCVYLAIDQSSTSYVCIKRVVKPALEECRGILLSRRLDHPGFVRTLDVFEDETYFYHCMEYIEGINLGLLKNQLSTKQTKYIALQLLEMLVDLRDKHLTFNDIKPDNIILGHNGQVYLIDVGAILEIGDILSKRFGSYYYSAPEYLAKKAVNEKADLYSVGKTLKYIKKKKSLFLDIWLRKALKRNESERFLSLEKAYHHLKNDQWRMIGLLGLSCLLLIVNPYIKNYLYYYEMKEASYLQAMMIDSSQQEAYEALFKEDLDQKTLLCLKFLQVGRYINQDNYKILINRLLEIDTPLAWSIQKDIYKIQDKERYELMENFSIDYLRKHTHIENVQFFCQYLIYLDLTSQYQEAYQILKMKNNPDTHVWMIEFAYRMKSITLLQECYELSQKPLPKALTLYRVFQIGNYQNGLLHQAIDLLANHQHTELYKKIQVAIQEWGDQA